MQNPTKHLQILQGVQDFIDLRTNVFSNTFLESEIKSYLKADLEAFLMLVSNCI